MDEAYAARTLAGDNAWVLRRAVSAPAEAALGTVCDRAFFILRAQLRRCTSLCVAGAVVRSLIVTPVRRLKANHLQSLFKLLLVKLLGRLCCMLARKFLHRELVAAELQHVELFDLVALKLN